MAEQETEEEEIWKPKTKLGRMVANGQITSIVEALETDYKLMEAELVDQLEELEEEVILIGGTPGKGGGKRRTVSKRTARMHKSGERYSTKAMSVLGNRRNVIGLGEGTANDTRAAIEDANRKAKLNLIQVTQGCGSWECGCGTDHTVPFEVEGSSGSVTVTVKPAPKGIGLACSDELKKMFELAGYTDVWVNARGTTRTRENLMKAAFNALKKVNEYKRE
ncbi:MAG: small subunit ribosomal protein S5 [Candidatus Nanohaloarchaea archaeon]|jgi:small subunit ribosomal protein S5